GGCLFCVLLNTFGGSDRRAGANLLCGREAAEQRSRRHSSDSTDPRGTFLPPSPFPGLCSFPQSGAHSNEWCSCHRAFQTPSPAARGGVSLASRDSCLQFRRGRACLLPPTRICLFSTRAHP